MAPQPGKTPLTSPMPFSYLALAPREGANLNIFSSMKLFSDIHWEVKTLAIYADDSELFHDPQHTDNASRAQGPFPF